MTKRLYIVFIVLMTVSLIVVIGVQAFWIAGAIKLKEKQYSQLIIQSLQKVSTDLEIIDKVNFVKRYKLSNSGSGLDDEQRDKFLLGLDNIKEPSVVEEKKIVQEIGIPRIEYLLSKEDTAKRSGHISTKKNKDEKETTNSLNSQILNTLGANDSTSVFLLALLEQKYEELANMMPIRKRVDKEMLESLLTNNLSQNDIHTRFEYAIKSKGLMTPVYSKRYKQNGAEEEEFVVSIFPNKDGESIYYLHVQFPEKGDLVLSSLWLMLLLSIIFTLIIIFAFVDALILIFKQKRSAEVKTDFINNMTHELKTPIATINLSIDALSNPKTLSDKDKILYYAKIIRDENNRMNQQIENVLRISRLDRNKLELYKEEASVNEMVEDAINHIMIIVEDRGGVVDFELDADEDIVKVDVLHFGNVLVNILDNANKYSVDAPEIMVRTFNEGASVVIEITDNGMGISKSEQEKIFDKFFRVSTGNVHNIKGQGLGLAYVKQIIDALGATISVRSKKGKGSTFRITIPLA